MTNSDISLVGVNLSGAEFGSGTSGYGSNYEYPTSSEIAYEASRGMNIIRVPISWERMQPTLDGSLDGTELSRLDDVVNYATSLGMKVDLDVHNYGKYDGQLVGSAAVPDTAFADLWGRLADHYKQNSDVMFGLMNEPAQTDAQGWVTSVNAAIGAIRATGATQEILVPGINYDGAWTWVGSPNATVIAKQVSDPIHNYSLEVHQYLDQDGSGTNYGPVYDTSGIDRISQITQWAEANGQRLFLGEIGVPPDPTSISALGNVLSYMSAHSDVWQGITYWAAGPLWGSYPLSAEPTLNASGIAIDAPQMSELEQYAPLRESAPTITLDTASPAAGNLGAGHTITFTLTTSEAVQVKGTPSLALNDGGQATYVPGSSSPTNLVFSTTVAAGQNAANLAVTGVSLPNGATIVDGAGNPADLSGATATFAGLEVDGTPPAVSASLLSVMQNSGPTSIGIAAPSDNLTAADGLAITVDSLPTSGTVTLGDGTTPVAAGENLTAAELESLDFTPAAGVFAQESTFAYTVTDGAGNATVGTAALDVGGPGAPTLAGTSAIATSAEVPVTPFEGVTLADPSDAAGATDTLTIALAGGGGTLSGAGLTANTDGTYGLSGSAAAVTAALDALSFTPTAGAPGATATTTFILSDVSSSGVSVSDSGSSVTDTAAPPATPPIEPPTPPIEPPTPPIEPPTPPIEPPTSPIEPPTSPIPPPGIDSETVTINSDGTITDTYSGGPYFDGRKYTSYADTFGPDGTLLEEVRTKRNGVESVKLDAGGQTLVSNGPTNVNNNGATHTTFVFNAGYGSDVISLLLVNGTDHDMLSFSRPDFHNSVAAVLHDTMNTLQGAIITDPVTGDALRLTGITKAQLAHNLRDITFHK